MVHYLLSRNLAMRWVLDHGEEGSVVYFADDDNTYDLRLFSELRLTKTLSLFPVGLVTKTGLSSPIVRDGKIVGFYDGWISNRKFPVDMAGFAVNLATLQQASSRRKGRMAMPFTPGYEEDGFLRQLDVKPADAQPLANNCTIVMVWHTKTHTSKGPADTNLTRTKKFKNSNLATLLASL